MFNDLFFLQTLILIFSIIFLFINNTFLIWYLILFFLIILSSVLFIDNFDIFVGFLLLIDLGVILIFLVFVFHFINFLDNKHFIKSYNYFLFFSVLLLILKILSITLKIEIISEYFFLISWYDYFNVSVINYKTDLNLLKEIYFYNNSFEFILINFFILYGLISSIILFFILKKLYLTDFINTLRTYNFMSINTSFFYIRNQNLINQQDEGASLKIINKKK